MRKVLNISYVTLARAFCWFLGCDPVIISENPSGGVPGVAHIICRRCRDEL